MFDPIKGPANHYQGPATGLGTEAGDTWHEAVSKINAGFERVVKAITGGSEATDPDARKDIAALEEAVAALQKRNDDLEASTKALLISFDKLTTEVSHIEGAASDTAFKADALERRLNDAAQEPDPAKQPQG